MTQDTATIRCRFCNAANRVAVERALRELHSVVCGSCRSGLLRVNGEPLVGLSNSAIAHPWDHEAIEKVRAIPYADEALRKVMGATFDRVNRFNLYSSALRITERQSPTLNQLYLEAAGRLDVDPPPLFVTHSPLPNAYTTGSKDPVIVITSAMLDLLDDRGIVGILGHELTHVKLGHVLYRNLAQILASGTLKVLNTIGLAKLALQPLKVMLTRWYHMSELSADRGEIIACGSLATYLRSTMMLAGGSQRFSHELDIGAFIDQAHEAEAMRDNDLLLTLSEMSEQTQRSHPVNVWRVHHALQWCRTQAFFDILAGSPNPLLKP